MTDDTAFADILELSQEYIIIESAYENELVAYLNKLIFK